MRYTVAESSKRFSVLVKEHGRALTALSGVIVSAFGAGVLWQGHKAHPEMIKDQEMIKKDVEVQSAQLKAEIYKTALDLGHHGDYERWREAAHERTPQVPPTPASTSDKK
mmetsp:Transcript_29066/g.74163  ORF Transcript_29066/g.74163 Transcript_29066/m.74163 type:complete len:110 (-) Transcript_29066:1018-1347(-)|eukprot:CAMPEP_0202866162 /NCGR_PEP_ID=MMETSP1391-20130828/7234_1 /ASSEMBLY_ACC=CAM_ASM_000867 /TAXON_ID=1034604 /ORGANISM="Chlamydomonas leiostraca, Strain SAG 11-49" /LENGTH=109 /DNA_ID=CAMNT_0049546085 /DNA_START=147 /DNA_END=476 /DNA_ORIENTATION=-